APDAMPRLRGPSSSHAEWLRWRKTGRAAVTESQHAMLRRLSPTKLNRSEEFLPWCCSQRFRSGMPVRANDHRSLFDLLWIVRLDDVNHVEAPQGRVALLPANPRALVPNLRGNCLCELLELVGLSEGLRRKSTENHIRGHSTPPCGHQRSSLLRLARSSLSEGLAPMVADRPRKQWAKRLPEKFVGVSDEES